jgi:polysaccharide deacetylase family protein (PEP-CTERM system associated)
MKILTFDIEEWFHILENESTNDVLSWEYFPVRIYENVDRILDILEAKEKKATFFIMGWIAKQYPEIIKKISNKGYDLGFHTNYHQLIHKLSPDIFYRDLKDGLALLEDIIGKKIIFFRAPGFSITEQCNWAFDILAEAGIEYDSSIFPILHAHGGYPNFPFVSPCLIKTKHGMIKEFPISVIHWGSKVLIYSGGGYFRLLPYWVIRNFTERSAYVMSYLHPRDMDPEQPIIKDISFVRKIRTYIGVKSTQNKFEKWISNFNFTDIQTASFNINWEKAPIIDLSNLYS